MLQMPTCDLNTQHCKALLKCAQITETTATMHILTHNVHFHVNRLS